MKLASKILKLISLAFAIVCFGLMFYNPLLVTKYAENLNLNYAQAFFKAPVGKLQLVTYQPAIGGFIGFLFVLLGALITLLSMRKVTKKNRMVIVLTNALGVVISLVGCLLIFITPNMFAGANPNLKITYSLSTVGIIAGFMGIIEAIIAVCAGIIDLNKKI